jgi:accessory colonization factor AcfC
LRCFTQAAVEETNQPGVGGGFGKKVVDEAKQTASLLYIASLLALQAIASAERTEEFSSKRLEKLWWDAVLNGITQFYVTYFSGQ